MNLLITLRGESLHEHDFERFKNYSLERAKQSMRDLFVQFPRLYSKYTYYKIEELDKDCYTPIRIIEDGSIIKLRRGGER